MERVQDQDLNQVMRDKDRRIQEGWENTKSVGRYDYSPTGRIPLEASND